MINRRLEAQEHKEWLDTVKEYKEKYPLTYDKGRLTCPEIMEAIYDITKGEAVITTEVGQHQMWAAQFYKYDKPRKILDIWWSWNNGIRPWSQPWSQSW